MRAVQIIKKVNNFASNKVLILLILGGLNTAHAQNAVNGDLTLDFVSSYYWRGINLGSVSLQPELSVGWKGLSFSVWGSFGLAKSLNEVDLTLSYTTGGLKLSVIDYWDDSRGARYFSYRPKETGHTFEASVGYDFGPVAVSWQTFFAGADLQADDRRAFSSYFEVSAPFRFITLDWLAKAAVVPWASDYYETECFACQMVSLKATKDIPCSVKFHLPIFAELMVNPNKGNLYFMAGLTIKAFEYKH